jgi:hypothetical protein
LSVPALSTTQPPQKPDVLIALPPIVTILVLPCISTGHFSL